MVWDIMHNMITLLLASLQAGSQPLPHQRALRAVAVLGAPVLPNAGVEHRGNRSAAAILQYQADERQEEQQQEEQGQQGEWGDQEAGPATGDAVPLDMSEPASSNSAPAANASRAASTEAAAVLEAGQEEHAGAGAGAAAAGAAALSRAASSTERVDVVVPNGLVSSIKLRLARWAAQLASSPMSAAG